jgi:hypothetical protein
MAILSSDCFVLKAVLEDQIKLLGIKKNRINSIIKLAKNNSGENNMKKDFKPLITMNLNSMKKNQNKKGG